MGPTCVCGDNMSVIHDTQQLESMLKKKSDSICHHAIRESATMGESLMRHVITRNNPADIATEVVSGCQKHDGLVEMLSQDTGNGAEDRSRKKQKVG